MENILQLLASYNNDSILFDLFNLFTFKLFQPVYSEAACWLLWVDSSNQHQ